jgi:hypothetical protein
MNGIINSNALNCLPFFSAVNKSLSIAQPAHHYHSRPRLQSSTVSSVAGALITIIRGPLLERNGSLSGAGNPVFNLSIASLSTPSPSASSFFIQGLRIPQHTRLLSSASPGNSVCDPTGCAPTISHRLLQSPRRALFGRPSRACPTIPAPKFVTDPRTLNDRRHHKRAVSIASLDRLHRNTRVPTFSVSCHNA